MLKVFLLIPLENLITSIIIENDLRYGEYLPVGWKIFHKTGKKKLEVNYMHHSLILGNYSFILSALILGVFVLVVWFSETEYVAKKESDKS